MTCDDGLNDVGIWVEHGINVGSGLASVVGALLTIIAFTFRHRLYLEAINSGRAKTVGWHIRTFVRHLARMPVLHRMIVFLAMSDFGAAVAIVLSHVHMMVLPESYTMAVCVTYRALIQYFFVASFLWTSLIATALLLQLMRMNMHFVAHFGIALIGWILPMADVLLVSVRPSLTMKTTGSGWCTLEEVYEWVFWFGPLLAAVVFNVIMFVVVLVRLLKLRRNQSSDMSRATRRHVFNVSLYLVVFLLCWVWDLLDHLFSAIDFCAVTSELFYLQSFFIPFQGAMNCIVYTLWNPNVKLPGFECNFQGDGPTEEMIEAMQQLRMEQEEQRRMEAAQLQQDYLNHPFYADPWSAMDTETEQSILEVYNDHNYDPRARA